MSDLCRITLRALSHPFSLAWRESRPSSAAANPGQSATYARWPNSPTRSSRRRACLAARSTPTWFVLKYLLGFNQVRNYDGSWTEWGNLIGAPIVNETVAAQPGLAASAR